MGKIKNILAAAIVSTMAFSMAGCDLIAQTDEAKEKTVLAVVGDTTITLGDVNNELQSTIDYLIEEYGEDYEDEISDSYKEQLLSARQSVLESLVDEAVLTQKAEELGLVPSDDDMATQVAEKKEELIEYYGDEDTLNEALEYYGYTDETFEEFLETQILCELVEDYMYQDLTVSDDEISAYYEENISDYTTYASATTEYIVFDTEDAANTALSDINAGTSTFDDLLSEYEDNASSGTYPYGVEAGTVEYSDTDTYDANFLSALSALGEGEMSSVVAGADGYYYIIYATDVVTEDTVTALADVYDTISSTVLSQKQEDTYDTTLEEWKEELGVETYEDKLES